MRPTTRPQRRDDTGTSAVELLMVMMIVAIIGGLTLTAIITTSNSQQAFAGLRDNLDESRIGLDRIRGELRGARRVFEGPADGHGLEFWVDIDGDDQLATNEVVHYELVVEDGVGRLERWTANAPTQRQVIARDLVGTPSEPLFVLDEPSPETQMVDVALPVDAGASEGIDPVTVRAQVRLRNVA